MIINPFVALIVLILGVGAAGLLLWLAEWEPWDGAIPPPERTIDPQDWDRR